MSLPLVWSPSTDKVTRTTSDPGSARKLIRPETPYVPAKRAVALRPDPPAEVEVEVEGDAAEEERVEEVEEAEEDWPRTEAAPESAARMKSLVMVADSVVLEGEKSERRRTEEGETDEEEEKKREEKEAVGPHKRPRARAEDALTLGCGQNRADACAQTHDDDETDRTVPIASTATLGSPVDLCGAFPDMVMPDSNFRH